MNLNRRELLSCLAVTPLSWLPQKPTVIPMNTAHIAACEVPKPLYDKVKDTPLLTRWMRNAGIKFGDGHRTPGRIHDRETGNVRITQLSFTRGTMVLA